MTANLTGRITMPGRCAGTSMLEILVTLLILAIGMLGLAGLQGQAHTSELESFQRGQALILLEDIAGRIEGNMVDAASYVGGPLGTGATDAANCAGAGSRAQIDLCEWSKALKGSSETKAGNKAGAMINGRGCVATTGVANTYMISVVWQGMNSTAPPVSTCGQGLYNSETSRRVVTMTVQIPDLSGA